MAKQRKFFTPEEKVSVLREHLADKKTVSEVCETHGIQPVLFYRWQKNMFDNAPAIPKIKRHIVKLPKNLKKIQDLGWNSN